jgi:uncharacterized RDD family membrane protein YckC
MKCPKCGYVGFESVNRCRNCGYEFSLAPPQVPELTIRDDASRDESPPDDLELVNAPAPQAPNSSFLQNVDRALGQSARPFPSDGTLFEGSQADDEPLIRRASPPRTPLSVRRATPEVPRLRTQPRMPMLDLGSDAGDGSLRSSRIRAAVGDHPTDADADGFQPASMASRLAAATVDLIVLGAIDVSVVYFTMQICGLTVADLSVLPKAPLLAFLLVQNGGYLVAFTAGGQTLGKMAAGIKVIPNESDATLDLGHSILRTLVWAVLAVPAGLGFLTAFFSHDRRGLHDRCAGTRVVRATA